MFRRMLLRRLIAAALLSESTFCLINQPVAQQSQDEQAMKDDRHEVAIEAESLLRAVAN